jgi:hypothetical protein
MPQESVRDGYRRTIDECARELAARQQNDVWLGRLRVVTFLPGLALIFYGLVDAAAAWPWLVSGGVLVIAFMVVVRAHEHTLRCAGELRERLRINEMQLARLDRRWGIIPACDVELPPQCAPIANDLDLFGHASLYQLISQARTPFGCETLRDWLLEPADVAEIADRQQAVSHLAPNRELREQIVLRARMLSASEKGTRAFVEWAESAPLLAKRPWLTWLTRLSPTVLVVLFVGALVGFVQPSGAFLAICAISCLHIGLNVFYGARIYKFLDRVVSPSHDVRQYRPLFEIIAGLPQDVPLFAKLQAHMGGSPREPLRHLDELSRLVRFANLRREGLFAVLYYLSQLFVLTDFHVVALMERWQRLNGSAVRRWLEAVGRLETITSLATLAHDNPQWCMPTVGTAAGSIISAQQLAHPLLADKSRVANDIELGPAGTFILVTGSNMSGKSTLLRAVGLNLILAQAGAPVCATQLCLPPVELATSMRTHDSLADGVSFFLAELQRLKQIVDQSRAHQQDSRLFVYLLDEVLQGTNSVERHIAVSRVINHLVEHGSTGMVSTHDLELGRGAELVDVCRTVHFRESFVGSDGDEKMTFDYKLRPGLASTTNALKLLKLVGLDD